MLVGGGMRPPSADTPFMLICDAACMTLVMLFSTIVSVGMGALPTVALDTAGVVGMPLAAALSSAAHQPRLQTRDQSDTVRDAKGKRATGGTTH